MRTHDLKLDLPATEGKVTWNVRLSFRNALPSMCYMPGFPVHHQLPKLAQTHVHQVGDAIQPSHPLLSPSPPIFSFSQHQGLFHVFTSGGQSIAVSASASVLPVTIQD